MDSVAPNTSTWLRPSLWASAAVFVCLYALYRRMLPKPIPGIPYNPEAAKSLLGDAPSMNRAIVETEQFNTWAAEQNLKHNSAIAQVFVDPFNPPWVLLSDFAESQDILMRRSEWDRSGFISDRMASMGEFQACYQTHATWKLHREWMKDVMTTSYLNTHVGPGIHETMLNFITLWEQKAHLASGRPIPAADDLNDVSLDCMLKFSFGMSYEHTGLSSRVDFFSGLSRQDLPPQSGGIDDPMEFPNSTANDFIQQIHMFTYYLERLVVSWLPKITQWFLSKTPGYRKCLGLCHEQVRKEIRKSLKRMGSGNEPQSASDHMIQREQRHAKENGYTPQFESIHFVQEVFGCLVAGHHTTGAALAWITKFMTEEQDAQTKLRTAIHEAFPQAVQERRLPTWDEICNHRVPYVEAFIEEALRLHATTVTRQAREDTVVLGHHIPKGSTIFLNSNGPGFYEPSLPVDDTKRSPTTKKVNLWDETKDLRVFQPERWLVANELGEARFEQNAGPQLIFGAGPRGCFGRRLAYIEMRVYTILGCWSFDYKTLPKPMLSRDAADGIAHRAKVCYVRPEKRHL